MKKLILTILPILLLMFSCSEVEKQNNEEVFYNKLDSLKSDYLGKEITITKRKFNEITDPSGPMYLYTSADREKIGPKVYFLDSVKYKLNESQVLFNEYSTNDFDKNLMISVELNS